MIKITYLLVVLFMWVEPCSVELYEGLVPTRLVELLKEQELQVTTESVI